MQVLIQGVWGGVGTLAGVLRAWMPPLLVSSHTPHSEYEGSGVGIHCVGFSLLNCLWSISLKYYIPLGLLSF